MFSGKVTKNEGQISWKICQEGVCVVFCLPQFLTTVQKSENALRLGKPLLTHHDGDHHGKRRRLTTFFFSLSGFSTF